MLFKKIYLMPLAWFFLMISCVFFISACNNEQKDNTSSEIKKKVIGLLIYNSKDPYVKTITEAIIQEVGDKATVIVAVAENNQLLQNEQIDRFLAEKVDGLIVNLVDISMAASVSEKANIREEENVPIVFFNREPDLSTLKPYGRVCFVGTITEQAGILQGDIIKKLWDENPEYDKNNDGIIQYIMIQASPDNVEAIRRTEFSVKQATKHGLKLQQIEETLMCEWMNDLAERAIIRLWPSIEDKVELIISNNDGMALGAIVALQKNGYNLGKEGGPYIPVIGVDALEQAIDAINNGIMAGTVKQDALGMAQAISKMMLNALNKKRFLQDTMLQWEESGVAVRIPYSLFTRDLTSGKAEHEDQKK